MARSRGRGIQFLDVLPEDGERRLMLAVLLDAIQSYNRYRWRVAPIAEYREWRRERAWFQANQPANPFSFLSICSALGLNADYVRRRVLGPSDPQRTVKVRRYAAKSEQAWARQRRANRETLGDGRSADLAAHASRSPRDASPAAGSEAAVSYCL